MFSTKAILVKLAYQYEVEAAVLLCLRMLFAFPFYVLIAATAKKSGLAEIRRKDYLIIGTSGLAGHYLASLSDFIGLQYITAGIERLVLYTYPTLILLMSLIFLKKTDQPYAVGSIGDRIYRDRDRAVGSMCRSLISKIFGWEHFGYLWQPCSMPHIW